MQCSNCGAQNDPSYRFCLKCGSPLETTNSPQEVNRGGQPETSVSIQNQSYTPTWQPEPPPVYQPTQDTAQPNPTPLPIEQPKPAFAPQPQYQQPPANPPPQTQTYQQPTGNVDSRVYGQSQINPFGVWRPFAGYGTRRRHVGWLMDNQGQRAPDLSNKVTAKFKERSINGAKVENKTLVGRGLIVESRPYFLLQRGLVTVGLYITQFGKDLFVSIASYLKPPISGARVTLLAVMTLFELYFWFIFPGQVNRAFGSTLGGYNPLDIFGVGGQAAPTSGPSLATLLCMIGPLGTMTLLALVLFVAYSLYKFVTEKDILAGLRVSPNEFNEDDLMALEKAVEQTVRMSLDEIGLNSDDLRPIQTDGGRII